MFEIDRECILKASNEKELIKGLEKICVSKDYVCQTFPNRCEIHIYKGSSDHFLEIKCSCGITNIWKKKRMTAYVCKCGKKLIKLLDKNKFDFIANRSEK